MKNVMKSFSANGTAMSKIQTVALTAIFWWLFGVFTMSFQTAIQNEVCDLEETTCPAASFSVQNNGCVGPCEITFVNQSLNATSFHWDFDDGNNSTEANPKHVYQNQGTYQVRLIAIVDGCEDVDIIIIDVVNN